jgi:hypothetical protein
MRAPVQRHADVGHVLRHEIVVAVGDDGQLDAGLAQPFQRRGDVREWPPGRYGGQKRVAVLLPVGEAVLLHDLAKGVAQHVTVWAVGAVRGRVVAESVEVRDELLAIDALRPIADDGEGDLANGARDEGVVAIEGDPGRAFHA